MKFDLKSLSRKDLVKLRTNIDKALGRLDEADRKAALAAAEKAAQAHGYSLADLTAGKPAKAEKPVAPKKASAANDDGRAKVAPKYRNPADASQTWSGRGRAPKWVEAHLAAGGTKDQLAI